MSLVEPITSEDSDMGITTALITRDLSQANYREFVAWVQPVSQTMLDSRSQNIFILTCELLDK